MSRANDLAYPATREEPYTASDGVVVGTHTVTHGGLTIREHVALEFATAIVASGRKSSSDVIGVMDEASEYTRAWLAEFTREPRK